jgi:hypothetical protein
LTSLGSSAVLLDLLDDLDMFLILFRALSVLVLYSNNLLMESFNSSILFMNGQGLGLIKMHTITYLLNSSLSRTYNFYLLNSSLSRTWFHHAKCWFHHAKCHTDLHQLHAMHTSYYMNRTSYYMNCKNHFIIKIKFS